MSIIFNKQNTMTTIASNLLFGIFCIYTLQVTAAPLEKSFNSPILFNDAVSPDYNSAESSLFFDTDHYSENIEKQEQIQRLLKRGITQYRAGKKLEGISSLKKAWEIAPHLASTGGTLAMHYIKDKKYQQALEIAKKQRIAFPKKPYSFIIEGFSYQGLDDKKQATYSFTKALQLDPGNLIASASLAVYALKENNIPQARKLYIDTLNYNPGNIRTLLLLSKLDKSQGDTQEVEKLIEDAIKTAPDTVLLHSSFAKIYSLLEKYPQAITEINKAIIIEPNNAANQFLLAKLLVSNDQLIESRAILNKLATAHPNKSEPKELEGRIALAQNKPKEAIKLFQQAIHIKSSTSAIMHLATAQMSAGESELGLATLRQQIKKEPKNILLKKLFAEHLRKLNQSNEAIQQYKDIIEQQPNNAIVINNLAWLLAEQDNIDTALQYIKKAHKLAPLNPNIMDTYALIALKKGHYIEANNLLRKALIKSPNNLSIQFHLAQTLIKQEKFKTAKALLNKLINLKKPFNERHKAKLLMDTIKIY